MTSGESKKYFVYFIHSDLFDSIIIMMTSFYCVYNINILNFFCIMSYFVKNHNPINLFNTFFFCKQIISTIYKFIVFYWKRSEVFCKKIHFKQSAEKNISILLQKFWEISAENSSFVVGQNYLIFHRCWVVGTIIHHFCYRRFLIEDWDGGLLLKNAKTLS